MNNYIVTHLIDTTHMQLLEKVDYYKLYSVGVKTGTQQANGSEVGRFCLKLQH